MGAFKHTLDTAQFDIIKGASTSHCLVDILHTLHSHADNPGSASTMLLTDFSKAFDHIDHTTAVSKSSQMGVSHSLVSWISDFLTNRQQCVRYGKDL